MDQEDSNRDKQIAEKARQLVREATADAHAVNQRLDQQVKMARLEARAGLRRTKRRAG